MKTYASYYRDLWNASSYVTGSHEFALEVRNGFSKRYKKRKLFLPIHKTVLMFLQFTKQMFQIYYKSNTSMPNNGS